MNRITELNKIVLQENLWDVPARAEAVTKELTALKGRVSVLDRLDSDFSDARVLFDLAIEERNDHEAQRAFQMMKSLASRAHQLEIETLMDGETDRNDVFLDVHSGAGGVDSQDWAGMVLRMYLRWCERAGYKSELIQETPGEFGIKSSTVKISGPYAYGWLKRERGVHRLVRISPFDANKRRHTSFCSVGVSPDLGELSTKIEIDEKDLRIDTYRASGAGGQHVNKTDSAVRITHLPTGIVTQSQSDRSQHRNRATAMARLQAELYARAEEERQQALNSETGEKAEIGWGRQIRSYVLQPYRLVKDVRTNLEAGNVDAVLDGEIGDFLRANVVYANTSKGAKGGQDNAPSSDDLE